MEQLLNSKVAVKVEDRPNYERDDQKECAFPQQKVSNQIADELVELGGCDVSRPAERPSFDSEMVSCVLRVSSS